MELSLREAVEIKKRDMQGIANMEFNYTREKIAEVDKVILSFCQSVLECKGAPQKQEYTAGIPHWLKMKIEGWNESCDLHQAWAAKMLDVERIARIIASVDLVSAEMWDMLQNTKLFYMQKAAAIVAGLKEGK